MRMLRPGSNTAIVFAVVGAFLSLCGVIVAIMFDGGLTERSTPVVMSILGTLGIAMSSLVAALKASDAADSAKDAKHTAEHTASNTATIAQLWQAKNDDDVCPALHCPLRDTREVK